MDTFYFEMTDTYGGGFQILTHRGRTSWSKRTADKHARDIQAQIDSKSGAFGHYKAVSVATEYALPAR